MTIVTRESVNSNGIDIETNAKNMYDSLQRISEIVNGSKTYFDSEAGDQMRKDFNASAAKFQEFQLYIKSYGEYLKNFADNISTYEEKVKSASSSIPKIG